MDSALYQSERIMHFLPSTGVGVMAILNVTPDSFSDGGQFSGGASVAGVNLGAVLQRAEQALAWGADVLDVGGESTRPGAQTIDPAEECRRVLPVVKALHQRFPKAIISVDTRKALVAEAALDAGAMWVNDVSGLCYDPEMASVVARKKAFLVLMHAQGSPETMQQRPHYPHGVVREVSLFFQQQLQRSQEAGISLKRILLDPGIGFGKTVEDNMLLLQAIPLFKSLGCPVLVGTSRKSFLTLGDQNILPKERESLTAASLAVAVANGVDMIRIHDLPTQKPVLRWLTAYHQITSPE